MTVRMTLKCLFAMSGISRGRRSDPPDYGCRLAPTLSQDIWTQMLVVEPLGGCHVNPGSYGTRPGVVRRRPGGWCSSRNYCPLRLDHNAPARANEIGRRSAGLDRQSPLAFRHPATFPLPWLAMQRSSLPVPGTRARLPAERLLTQVSDECLLASAMKTRMRTKRRRNWWFRGLGRTTVEYPHGRRKASVQSCGKQRISYLKPLYERIHSLARCFLSYAFYVCASAVVSPSAGLLRGESATLSQCTLDAWP